MNTAPKKAIPVQCRKRESLGKVNGTGGKDFVPPVLAQTEFTWHFVRRWAWIYQYMAHAFIWRLVEGGCVQMLIRANRGSTTLAGAPVLTTRRRGEDARQGRLDDLLKIERVCKG